MLPLKDLVEPGTPPPTTEPAGHRDPVETSDQASRDLLLELNPRQREAVEAPDGPLLIFAGAGSGKTRVLTYRIAYLIRARRAYPGQILAVTFTNKAAREMRARVEALLQLSAASIWMGTFHAMAVRLLRREAAAAQLDSHFQIYDEVDRLGVVRKVMGDLKIDEKRYPPGAIVHAISQAKNELQGPAEFARTVSSYFHDITHRVFQRYEAYLEANSGLDFDDLILRAVRLLEQSPEVRDRYQRRFRHVLVDEYQDTNHAQYVLVQRLAAGHRNLCVVGDDDQCLAAGTKVTMADGSARPIEDVGPGDFVRSCFGSGDFRPARVLRVHTTPGNGLGIAITTRSGRRIVSTPEHTHFAGYRLGLTHDRPRGHKGNGRNVVLTLCGQRRGSTPMHRISLVGRDTKGRRGLERHGLKVRRSAGGWRYESVRKDYRELLDMVAGVRSVLDVNVILQARLGRNSAELRASNSLPFISAASVRRGMAMFDADGAYDIVERVEWVPLDTSVHDLDIEWTHNYVAEGVVTHNSIYGWRGADVRNILSFEKDYPDARVVKLEQNYRSTQTVLDVANHIIRDNPNRAPKQLWTENPRGNRVVVTQVYDEEQEALAVAAEVQALVNQGSAALADIAVLYRTNAQSRALEEVFLRRGIPYKLVGGLKFYERREVKDVLAYLRLIANPRDGMSLARVINVPRRKIGDKTLSVVSSEAARLGCAPWEVLSAAGQIAGIVPAAAQALERFHALISELIALSQRRGVVDLFDEVVQRTGYQALLQDGTPEGEERWANLLELRGLASEYSGLEPREGLQTFLEDAALVSDVDTLDERAQGVTLITLHMVKGLEFRVVFLTGMEDGLFPHQRSFELPAGLEEERRLCYVGVTRAKERLYFFHTFRRHLYGSATLNIPSRFLADIPPKLIRAAPGLPDGRTGERLPRDYEAVAPAAPLPAPKQHYQPGDQIKHRSFGRGTVLKSTLTRTDEELIIRFETAGVKILAVSVAPLTRA
jgi:DNA helicase-2/ATP-dependent DNA helicase PcrA